MDWASIASNLAATAVGTVTVLGVIRRRTRAWVAEAATEAILPKLEQIASAVDKLTQRTDTTERRLDDHLNEAERRNARLDAHIRDHQSHRRTWRF